jgi:hypothetical protein
MIGWQELCSANSAIFDSNHQGWTPIEVLMSVADIADGFFIDWDGNARSTRDAGGGYVVEADPVAKYVAIMQGSALVHEGTFYKTLEDIKKAGITASFVPGSHPWGKPEDGF